MPKKVDPKIKERRVQQMLIHVRGVTESNCGRSSRRQARWSGCGKHAPLLSARAD